MNSLVISRVRARAVVLAVALSVLVGLAPVADARVSPIANRTAGGVTADALPTVQIDGVVWAQAIVGNTVYVGGDFANARPAGAPARTNLTPRSNLLAYNLSTGALITSFDLPVNGPVRSVVASPDGSRVYIGGSFTSVGGRSHARIAAFSTATGQLISSFAPRLDSTVNAIAATDSTVYVGGDFGAASGVPRTRLAAFHAGSGTLLAWAPTANYIVHALQLTPNGTHLVVGGAFSTLNGATAPGVGSLDVTTGASVPFAVNRIVRNSGTTSAILALSSAGRAIYGVGYSYGKPGFEGAFSVNPHTGALNWLEDCHGDSYGVYPSGGQVYVVSHAHDCGNLGGFRETNPETTHRTTAFTTQATGTLTRNGSGSVDGGALSFTGEPSPSLVNWFPDLTPGTYTKQYQAAWTVTGNGSYVVEGGEFLTVNGTPQQGLVRFAVPSLAPRNRGPMDTSGTAPTARTVSDRSVTLAWQSNWDQDNGTLTYTIERNGTPVHTLTAMSEFWHRPTVTYIDTGLSPNTSYRYSLVTRDPDGNTVRSATTAITTIGSSVTSASVSPAAPVTGQRLTVRALVRAVTPGSAPVGSVTVAVDGRPTNAGRRTELRAAAATVSVAGLRAGRHTLTVRYSGDASHGPSAVSRVVTVAAGRTTARVTSSAAGTLVRLRATVRAVAPAAGYPTRSVLYYVDGHRRATRTLHSGAATYSLRLARGTHQVLVRYLGSSSYRASTSTSVTQVVR